MRFGVFSATLMKHLAVCLAIFVFISSAGCGDFQPPAYDIVVVVPNTYRGVVKIIEDKKLGNPQNRADHFVIDESGTCIAADVSLLFTWHRIKALRPDGQHFPSDTGAGGAEGDVIALREVGCGHDSNGRRYAALVIGTHADTHNWYDVHNRQMIQATPSASPVSR